MARKGKMFDKEINSKYLHETMLLKIYEPEEFNPIYENNICIMQDGNDYFQLGKIATVSDQLHSNFEIVNTYFVGIHYIDRLDRLKKYHPSGEQFEAYKQFLALEVSPLLDKLLPINPLGTVQTLMGDSLAGTIAFMTATEFPSTFQKVIMQSPLVNDVVLQAATQLEERSSLEIYHSIGLKETEVTTTQDGQIDFLTPNEKLSKILTKKVTTYHYHKIKNGNHTWKYWQKELPVVLAKMLS